jgi:STE24 endopeptidase
MPQADSVVLQGGPAKQYQAIKYRLFFVRLVATVVFLLIFLATGWSRSLKVWLLTFREDFFSVVALYVSCFSLLASVLSLPLDAWEGFFLEHRFGLSRQSFPAWFKDFLKKSTISFVVTLVFLEGAYFFLSEFPRSWWLGAVGLWFFLSIVLARIFPQVILPLFFRVRPLEEGEVRQRLLGLFARFQIKLNDIFVLDFSKKTVKANAMVSGLGRTKRIFLTDTLLAAFSPEEIEVVMAHEVGHYLKHDTARMVAAGLVSGLVTFGLAFLCFDRLLSFFGFTAPGDVAALPLLLLILFAAGLLLLPLQNGFSRVLERRADGFALETTRANKAFISMMKKLAEKNLSDMQPPRWAEVMFYDHPPISRRIEMASRSCLTEENI